jgi:hypothetical protein
MKSINEPQPSICVGHASIYCRLQVEVLWRERELRIETPEVGREKSIVVVGLERGHGSIDREIWEFVRKDEMGL